LEETIPVHAEAGKNIKNVVALPKKSPDQYSLSDKNLTFFLFFSVLVLKLSKYLS
jgi:phosphate starvation-inducible membrane PsiE